MSGANSILVNVTFSANFEKYFIDYYTLLVINSLQHPRTSLFPVTMYDESTRLTPKFLKVGDSTPLWALEAFRGGRKRPRNNSRALRQLLGGHEYFKNRQIFMFYTYFKLKLNTYDINIFVLFPIRFFFLLFITAFLAHMPYFVVIFGFCVFNLNNYRRHLEIV